MAGEIQLNSTTLATESSGSITAQLDVIRPNTTNGSLTLQGDSSDSGVTGLTIDSSGNATFAQTIAGGTIGSSVVFPTGHMIYRELQSEYQPNTQNGQTATNVATTLSVTPLSTTSKFIFNIFGACYVGTTSVGYGAQVTVDPNYSLNSDMSSSTAGNPARANYFNVDSSVSGQDLANAAGTFYSSTEFSHSGNTYYFNVDLTINAGYRGYFRNINLQIIEVF